MPFKNSYSVNKQYIVAIFLPLVISAICFFFKIYINAPVVAFLLLVLLSTLAMFFDIVPVVVAALLSAISWDYLFLKPPFEFFVDNTEDMVLLSSFFFIALLNGVLTYKIRKADQLLREKEEKANIVKLYDTLFSSLSHELRTPVTTIAGCADTLLNRRSVISDSDREILLNEISAASFRLSQEINNLLNMSRLESGFLHIRKEWCDVKDLIEETIASLKYKSADHHIQLNISERLPLVSLDFGLIQQVIANLLNNALQYTPAGSSILMSAFVDKKQLVIKVSDNGPGIPESEHQKAFDKFFRGANCNSGGTGLGLSIVKGFVEAHKGTVNIQKSEMGGAEFIISIPVSSKELYETSEIKSI